MPADMDKIHTTGGKYNSYNTIEISMASYSEAIPRYPIICLFVSIGLTFNLGSKQTNKQRSYEFEHSQPSTVLLREREP